VASKQGRRRKRQDRGRLRNDVREALDRLWPDGVVALLYDCEESYFQAVHGKLSGALARIRDARLLCEREADGGPVWWEHSDPENDPPDELEPSRSYHLFFVAPQGREFTFDTEREHLEEPDPEEDAFGGSGCEEHRPARTIAGRGRTGWSVAVSLLAPFAVITLSDVATFDDGSETQPAIERYGETPEGEPIDPEESFLRWKGRRRS
jgi:hypothetical protein